MTILADPPRADLYVQALNRHAIKAEIRDTQQALISGPSQQDYRPSEHALG